MEQRGLLLSALGVGVGVGVGLGLASGQSAVGKWIGSNPNPVRVTAEQIEQELLRIMVDGKDSRVTFDEFPYYISEQTKALLTSAAYVHLKHAEISKFTRNLSPASRTILLSGPAELYQQMLAKALAQFFEAKLLLLDVVDFSVKIQNKYGYSNKDDLPRSISGATMEKMSSLFGSLTGVSVRDENRGTMRRQMGSTDITKSRNSESGAPSLERNSSASSETASQSTAPNASCRRMSSWAFDEKMFIQVLYKVLVSVSVSEGRPLIIYFRDVESLFSKSDKLYNLFDKLLKRLNGPVLILGSRVLDEDSEYCGNMDERLVSLFPYNIEIRAPHDEGHLVSWKTQLETDMKVIQFQDNKNHITEVLAANDLVCDDLGSVCEADTVLLSSHIEEIIMSAISFHLMNQREPEYRNGKLVISSNSLSHGLSIFQDGKNGGKVRLERNAEVGKTSRLASRPALFDSCAAYAPSILQDNGTVESVIAAKAEEPKGEVAAETKKESENTAPKKEVVPDNEFEKRIRPEVIPASEIGVTFEDIGALEETKESLQELVLLPLTRPDLFKGGLLKPCRGILLFGPPGTGKTMLAKAIANEAGASFINVSMSTITSKWFGEDEKNVRALFTLAAKVSPTIIFIDEVDSMLGQRTRVGEHEAMRKIKNEFMTHWDGLMTKSAEQILVLAATNRPFDLDEAIIRRFERRIMVGLPSTENREKILRTLLSKDKVEELDYKELATMTDGYTGSDLKNLCITAAYRPVRELIQKEREKATEKKKKAQENNSEEGGGDADADAEEEEVINLRALNMDDMKWAKSQIASSFASQGAVMNELKQWNELYGEGGSRKMEQLTYFL
ncbi:hypothetical protein V2J09_022371 [Rumex salicifolius]